MALVRAGIRRWSVSLSCKIPGRPDVYFPELPLAVFVDGCFWHGCPQCGHVPRTRADFWREKFRLNRERDKRVGLELTRQGIYVLRVWEHEVRDFKLLKNLLIKIKQRIHAPKETP
jgi:DNA mismatch endonuclease (patch repair protein)